MIIHIRPASAREAEKLTEIAFASKRHWEYPEAWIELWSDELTVSEGYVQANPVFCAVMDSKVVGWFALCHSEAACEIDYFWVLPEAIGKGVGAAMMRHAKDLLLNSQADFMRVISDPHAEGFYLKMGFEKIGMHPSRPKGRMLPILTFSKKGK